MLYVVAITGKMITIVVVATYAVEVVRMSFREKIF
jgi:hypothetical protein